MKRSKRRKLGSTWPQDLKPSLPDSIAKPTRGKRAASDAGIGLTRGSKREASPSPDSEHEDGEGRSSKKAKLTALPISPPETPLRGIGRNKIPPRLLDISKKSPPNDTLPNSPPTSPPVPATKVVEDVANGDSKTPPRPLKKTSSSP